MRSAAAIERETTTAGWMTAVRRTNVGEGISVDLWFECQDAVPWSHVCRVRDGRVTDWRPEDGTRPCIGHARGLMQEALAGRVGMLDRRWRFAPRPGDPWRPLPPGDLIDTEFDIGALGLPDDLCLAWTTTCTTPEGEAVTYASDLRDGRRVRHRAIDPAQPQPTTRFTQPVVDHLRLRSGGAVMASFDRGGVDGAIDELIFLAGLVDSPLWREAWSIADGPSWRVHDHLTTFAKVCGTHDVAAVEPSR